MKKVRAKALSAHLPALSIRFISHELQESTLATAANDVALRRTPNYRTEYRPRGTRLCIIAIQTLQYCTSTLYDTIRHGQADLNEW